jgi:hypothetical protein
MPPIPASGMYLRNNRRYRHVHTRTVVWQNHAETVEVDQEVADTGKPRTRSMGHMGEISSTSV